MAAVTGAILLAVAACGNSSTSSGGSKSDSPKSNGPNASSFTLKAPPSVKSANVLKVCADIVYPPFTFREDNKAVGIDVDLVSSIAEAMGVKVEWVQTSFPGIIGALQGKKCDAIVNGINGTPEHEKVIAQVAYLRDTKGFITKKGNPANIKTLDDLSGKNVATQLGSSTEEYLKGLNKKFKSENKAPFTLTAFPQDTAAFAAVLSNRVDTYFQDVPVLGYYAKKHSDIEILPIEVSAQTNVVGLRKDDTELAAAFKDGISKMYELGIMKKIAEKWGVPDKNFLPDMPTSN